MKQMINQINRLENKNNILEKKNNKLRTENEKLQFANKKLQTENEKLQFENGRLQNIIIDIAIKFNNSEERNSQQYQIIQDISTVLFEDEELSKFIKKSTYHHQ